jgi:hypothetical protein
MAEDGSKHDMVVTTLGGHRQEQLKEPVATSTTKASTHRSASQEKQAASLMAVLSGSWFAVS